MNRPKRKSPSRLLEQQNFAASTSALIETPVTSVSLTSENRLNHSTLQANQLIDWQERTNGFHHEKSESVQNHYVIPIKSRNQQTAASRTTTILDKEDDWVCPVAVALRRAGYDVPLRPSKSWLERDRRKQALLSKQSTSSNKEI